MNRLKSGLSATLPSDRLVIAKAIAHWAGPGDVSFLLRMVQLDKEKAECWTPAIQKIFLVDPEMGKSVAWRFL